MSLFTDSEAAPTHPHQEDLLCQIKERGRKKTRENSEVLGQAGDEETRTRFQTARPGQSNFLIGTKLAEC